MCGIIGILGFGDKKTELIKGLELLEYRGYDSAGIAVIKDNKVYVVKKKGKIGQLRKLTGSLDLYSFVGIGHTRWATHGVPSDVNAHPHLDCKSDIAIVHNGIIENYMQLKQPLLEEGHHFFSQTDSEVIAHLIERYYSGDLLLAVEKAVSFLRGSYALLAVSKQEPSRLVAVRKGSPLVLGVADGKLIFASDVAPILLFTKRIIYLNDGDIVDAEEGKFRIMHKGSVVNYTPVEVKWDVSEAQRGGYQHFMLKEIHEEPDVLRKLITMHVRGNQILFPNLEGIDFSGLENIYIVGCGTAYHAGLVSKYIFEKVSKLSVEIDVASEWRYRDFIVRPNSICIAISQSGETADTLAAVAKFQQYPIKVIGICNVIGSSLTRLADSLIFTHAGMEISVASTKAYMAQLIILYLLAFYIAQKKGIDINVYLGELANIPEQVMAIIEQKESIKSLAERHHRFGSFLYLGRNLDYPTALEGALKLKEISYIPAEGYPAGEMKHGPIALIDEYRAVVCIATDSFIYEKIYSNIEEIKARKGKIIIIASQGNTELREEFNEIIYVPKGHELFSPLINIVPLQLFAYYVALVRGCNVDRPRNLAKSVTVE